MAIKSNISGIKIIDESVRALLPSGGFYLPNYLLENGTLKIKPWGHTLDKEIVKSAKKKGRDIFLKIIQKVTDIPIELIPSVLIGDATTISLVARSLRKSGQMVYTSRCPSCDRTEEEHIRLPDDLRLKNSPDGGYSETYEIILPKIEDHVKLSYISLDTVDKARDRTESIFNNKIGIDLNTILYTIVEIGDGKDYGKPENFDEICTWFNALPVSDQTFLEESANKSQPSYVPEIEHLCSNCGTTFYHTIRLDEQFFR